MSKSSATFRIARLCLAASALALLAASPALTAELALKRAILGTGGVGYFEYAAEVDAAATLHLRARLDQVDDILKSLIVIDPAGAASVTLPGKAGAAEAFASLPFSEDDLASLSALVGALKGAAVSVEAPRKLAGTIVSVASETIKAKGDEQRQVTRVALLNGTALDHFILEDAEGMKFDDARVGAQVETALKALRAARDRSGRDFTIRLAPGGKRIVKLGYVAEAPVWKAAYRLSLPKGGGKARLQGWAVLENMTGAEWNDVTLTLTSGSPVTFRQALYDPYYVTRQTVAPPVSRLALPRADQGQIAALDAEADLQGRRNNAPAAAAPQVARKARTLAAGGAENMAQEAMDAPPPPAPAILGATAPSADSADNLSGATFSLTAPVKVLAGESLTLPFIDTEVTTEEMAWLQPGLVQRNAWHALRLANGGATSLPPGSMTLYETTDAGPLFAGEAQLNILPAGQNRLVAFGADQKLRVERETTNKGLIAEIILAKATMTVKRLARETTVYRLTNDDSKPRKIIIDHPRAPGLTLAVPPASEAALAENAWRMTREVAPGKTEVLEVSVDRLVDQAVAIGGLSRAGMEQALAADGRELGQGKAGFVALLTQIGIDPAMRDRLQKLAEAADALEDANRRIAKLAEDREAIVADQERLRANLSAAPAGSDLAKLATRKLLAQEAQIDSIEAEKKAAANAVDAARSQLEELAGRAAAQELRYKNKATL